MYGWTRLGATASTRLWFGQRQVGGVMTGMLLIPPLDANFGIYCLIFAQKHPN